MSKFDFDILLPASQEKLIDIATDYKNFQRFFPQQIKHINILKSNEHETVTEEVLFFSTMLKADISQQTIHRKILPNKLESKVISGPFKNSILMVGFNKADSGTHVIAYVDLKIDLKYRILSPIIKKRYKTILTALFYKINTLALD